MELQRQREAADREEAARLIAEAEEQRRLKEAAALAANFPPPPTVPGSAEANDMANLITLFNKRFDDIHTQFAHERAEREKLEKEMGRKQRKRSISQGISFTDTRDKTVETAVVSRTTDVSMDGMMLLARFQSTAKSLTTSVYGATISRRTS